MSLLTVRGGFPWIWRGPVTTTVVTLPFPNGNCNYLKVRSDKDVRIYFSQTDAQAANGKYVLVPAAVAAVAPYGEWSGPADCGGVWLLTASGTAQVELCAFTRMN